MTNNRPAVGCLPNSHQLNYILKWNWKWTFIFIIWFTVNAVTCTGTVFLIINHQLRSSYFSIIDDLICYHSLQPSLSEIMQMRIEANKLLLKDPTDLAAKKILHEAQILVIIYLILFSHCYWIVGDRDPSFMIKASGRIRLNSHSVLNIFVKHTHQ